MVRADAASRRARGLSPAPSARETVAELAMVSPMLIDMMKNVDQAGIADSGLERLIAELRHPEQRQKVDDEHRHQADGAGRRHHRDMAHQRPVREHGPLVVSGAGGVQDSFLLARAAVLRPERGRKLGAAGATPHESAYPRTLEVFRLTTRLPASYLTAVFSPRSRGQGRGNDAHPSSRTRLGAFARSFRVCRIGALAQQAEAMKYCKADVARLCPGVPPGGGRIIACLKAAQGRDEHRLRQGAAGDERRRWAAKGSASRRRTVIARAVGRTETPYGAVSR